MLKHETPLRPHISELLKSRALHRYCFSIAGEAYGEDLCSHVILLLIEMPDDGYSAIRNLRTYACGMAWEQFRLGKSSFNSLYRRHEYMKHEELTEAYGIPEEEEQDTSSKIAKDYAITVNVIEKNLRSQIDRDKFPVDHYIFEAYQKYNSIRKTADHFEIPRSTVHRIIQNFKTKISNEATNNK